MAIAHWAGTEDSFDVVTNAKIKLEKMDFKAGWLDEAMAALPPVWEKQGDLAVIRISGSLVSDYAGMMRIFGCLGYADINDAFLEALGDEDVKKIFAVYESTGGSVNGVGDLADVLAKVNTLKPIYAHAERVSASASYWLMAASSYISLGTTAILGSIGTLVIHTQYVEQLAQMGVKKTVMRSGEFKALANPFEVLSETAKIEIQSQLDDLSGMFDSWVAAQRGFDKGQMALAGQGREFMGKRAVAIGLADKVMNFDRAYANVKKLDAAKTVPDNRSKSKGTLAMKILTEAQLAQIAAGVPEATVRAQADAAVTEPVTAPTVVTPVAATAAPVAAVAVPAVAPVAAVSANEAVVANLMAQLDAANTAKTAAMIEAAGFKAASEALPGLLAIARSSVGKMAVALGGTDTSAQTLDAQAVITEHARVTDLFTKKFVVGGAAATSTVVEPPKAQTDARFAASVKFAPSAK